MLCNTFSSKLEICHLLQGTIRIILDKLDKITQILLIVILYVAICPIFRLENGHFDESFVVFMNNNSKTEGAQTCIVAAYTGGSQPICSGAKLLG